MRYLLLLVAVALAGCATAPRHTLGKPAPGAVPATVGAMLSGTTAKTALLHGAMVEKCPVSGCWLRLKDDTGVVKVDLRGTGETATDIPVGTAIAVTGTRTQTGDETVITASGLTY